VIAGATALGVGLVTRHVLAAFAGGIAAYHLAGLADLAGLATLAGAA